MPRVAIKKKEYKIIDLKGWIVHQMKVRGLRQTDVAKALNISQPRFSTMLKIPEDGKWVTKDGQRIQKDPFSYGDLLTLFELFETTDEEKQKLLTL